MRGLTSLFLKANWLYCPLIHVFRDLHNILKISSYGKDNSLSMHDYIRKFIFKRFSKVLVIADYDKKRVWGSFYHPWISNFDACIYANGPIKRTHARPLMRCIEWIFFAIEIRFRFSTPWIFAQELITRDNQLNWIALNTVTFPMFIQKINFKK